MKSLDITPPDQVSKTETACNILASAVAYCIQLLFLSVHSSLWEDQGALLRPTMPHSQGVCSYHVPIMYVPTIKPIQTHYLCGEP